MRRTHTHQGMFHTRVDQSVGGGAYSLVAGFGHWIKLRSIDYASLSIFFFQGLSCRGRGKGVLILCMAVVI